MCNFCLICKIRLVEECSHAFYQKNIFGSKRKQAPDVFAVAGFDIAEERRIVYLVTTLSRCKKV